MANRYASSYDSDGSDGVAFSDSWNDGAKYQQLKGSGGSTNAGIDSQFAALSKGGSATKTVADDGDGWMLLKQDKTSTSDERVQDYKKTAAEWQAAGYDVRVQDHNPEFGADRNSEIAVRKSVGDSAPEQAPADDPVELSPEVLQAKERVAKYEGDILSGETSRRIYGNSQNFADDYKLNLQNSQKGFMSKYQFDPNSNSAGATDERPTAQQYQPNEFSGSDISPYETPEATTQATSNFLDKQKQKNIKDFNIKSTTTLA